MFFVTSVAIAINNVNIYGAVGDNCSADRGANCVQGGEEYHTHTHVTFSEVNINGNVRYLCNADRLATCRQNSQGYSDCQYYGSKIRHYTDF
ncbi:hypothetical protein TI05_17220 [Achromatium sp. WMS3]|nr:hypothetical protein TI05_17220 [Achromatium sp. WMS3]